MVDPSLAFVAWWARLFELVVVAHWKLNNLNASRMLREVFLSSTNGDAPVCAVGGAWADEALTHVTHFARGKKRAERYRPVWSCVMCVMSAMTIEGSDRSEIPRESAPTST